MCCIVENKGGKTESKKLRRSIKQTRLSVKTCLCDFVCTISHMQFAASKKETWKTSAIHAIFAGNTTHASLFSVLLKSFRHARLGPWRGGENALDQEVWARHDSESIEP